MPLLLDENLPRSILPRLQASFPESNHVVVCGLERADDEEIWQYALDRDFIIVSKDRDFADPP